MSKQERAVSAQPYTKQIDRADIVIVGNGIAGLTTALEARRLAPDKRIVIVTDQIHPTINTPALKQFAIGKLTREQLLAHPAGTERAERIHVVTARVEEIHANSKYVTLSGGRGFGYESLLIATGSTPNGLPAHLPGRDFDGVCTLHRLQDYLNLRRRLSEVSEAVVVGGGVHAIETVMGLLFWGIRVHWLIRGDHFMANVLDSVASEMVLERVRHAGGNVVTETEMIGVVGRVGTVAGVITNHQQMIPCQLVLVCTGTQPLTTLADHCTHPLLHKRGIYVDDQLRTSVPNIYAAGDVAALKNPLTGEYEPRAQWYAAVSQGRTAAATITGHKELARQPFGVHWHATHLGDLSMLTVGNPLEDAATTSVLTDTSQGGYRRIALVDDRMVGYLALGSRQPDSLAIKRIIDEGHSVRDITKDLLKGTLDARRHLSQQHTRTAQGILTGKLPELPTMAPEQFSSAQRQRVSPDTDSLALTRRRQTDSLVPLSFMEEGRVSEPLHAVNARTRNLSDDGDTGSHIYPTQNTESGKRTRELPIPEEEMSPFMGNLPSLPPPRVVTSTLATNPAEQKTTTRSLWSYKTDTTSAPKKSTRRSSRSIWSYSSKDKDSILERDR